MTLVALSAAYGAAGNRIGPALAEELGVPFVDRAIPGEVAERLDVPLDVAVDRDEQVSHGWLERLLSGFIGQDPGAPVAIPGSTILADDFRRATEDALLAQAATGEGVILGRASVVVLRDDPRVLRARLHGPVERRLEQVVRLEGIDRETAERGLRKLDRAHAAYVAHFYGVDVADPSLYHVVLDSTAIELDACVEILAQAARSHTLSDQRSM